jgi:release factor glutamine methyltransferase
MGSVVEPSQQPWTVLRLLNWTREYFDRSGVEDGRLCAEVLLAHALGCERIQLYIRHETVPETGPLAKFRESVKLAAKGMPIAYLVESKEFYSLSFVVTQAVLIPRPETESLVDEAIEVLKDGGEHLNAWDLGTGSGCIAVALVSRIDHLNVIASDVSSEALLVAGRNVETHGLFDRITTVEADGLALPVDMVPDGGFDVIVSNPPYVADDDLETLDAHVLEHEPREALFAGPDGLRFYRILAEGAGRSLKTGGHLLVEIGFGQADPIEALFAEEAGWSHVRTVKDRVQGHDRVMVFRWKA